MKTLRQALVELMGELTKDSHAAKETLAILQLKAEIQANKTKIVETFCRHATLAEFEELHIFIFGQQSAKDFEENADNYNVGE